MKNKFIEAGYKRFSLAEGSQHIASEYAIRKLQEVITVFRIKNVLEIGLGIGSISGILLKLNKNLNYSGTENNEFCLEALKSNLGKDFEHLQIFPSLNEVKTPGKFDLIIIDGTDADLHCIKKGLAARGIIAIEGDRLSQENLLTDLFS